MPKVAIWTHGGVGGGHFSQGQPPVQDLVERLSSSFDVDVYSFSPPAPDFHAGGYRIFFPDPSSGRTVSRWFSLMRKFVRCHSRGPYDVIYGIWGYPAGVLSVVLGILMRIPSVVHLQGGDAAKIPGINYGVFNHPLRSALCRFAYARCARLIVLSQFQAAFLRDNGVTRTPLVVPFGPDLNKFRFVSRRFDQPVLRFLHVGNQTPVKGQETMLKTFALVNARIQSRLVIVGDDYYQGQLAMWCRSLGIEEHVHFAGAQPHGRMPAFYHDADFLLHTPLFEGQGVVFAEAAACGTIIAGTNVGMLSDMGEDCGLIVCSGDAENLATKIIDATQSKEKLIQLRMSAYEWVQKKDVTYTETTLTRILRDLVPHADSRTFETSTDKAER